MTFLFWCAIGAIAGTVFSSLFEWTLHRYLMHRSILVKFFSYPFDRHTLIHHHIFKADHTYHLINEPDKKTIPMAWWNGPVLVACVLLPFLAWSFFAQKWGILTGAAIAGTLYFTAYEYMHWCMHLPKKRHVERSGIFFRLNGHHLLHHRYMGKNFNVVLPLADLCLGTLILRSKVNFPQAQGPAVPNIQPNRPIPRLETV
ncbi:MAG TPA: fatty acid hydroxylase [Verrucomicrobiae bacterium]|nr:fatty acid hydroxylase [Verrucomicrobiae bacterium]